MRVIKEIKIKRNIFIVFAIVCASFTSLNFANDKQNIKDIESMLKDPKQIVKLHFYDGMPYYKYAQAFDQNDLSEFYEILNDPNSSPFERIHAINFIGHITDRGKIKVSKVLMEYVQKEIDWDRWQKDDAYYITVSKRFAMDWLGYVGCKDKNVVEFLKKAMTSDGIREITKQWYKGVPESASSEKATIENLRGYAAKGIAYSDDPNLHELIRSEYEREKQTCINAGLVGDYYFYQLCEAVTRIDIIKDIGIEGHLALSDGKMSYDKTYLKYQIKYLIQKPTFDFNDINIK